MSIIAIDNPYIEKGQWYKGSFHNHSEIFSVGECICSMIEAGCDFLTMSEHDQNKPECMDFADKVVVIPGFEQSTGPNPHVVVANTWHKGRRYTVTKKDYQDFINELNSENAIIIMAHPHWQREDYWPEGYLEELYGYTGVEILNSSIIFDKAHIDGEYDYWDIAVDVWDKLLSSGKVVWGFGNDDFHHRKEFNKSYNIVKAERLSRESIVESVKRGSFVVSTGACIEDIFVDDNEINILLKSSIQERKIYSAIGKNGRLLKKAFTTENRFSYRPDGTESYVRLHVLFESGKALFTQPFFIRSC
ncbi:MAG: hypothetical protein HPY74_01120 [Firmicutes bacterium]|nr:hypothetical protein [Bacillota bacterium]